MILAKTMDSNDVYGIVVRLEADIRSIQSVQIFTVVVFAILSCILFYALYRVARLAKKAESFLKVAERQGTMTDSTQKKTDEVVTCALDTVRAAQKIEKALPELREVINTKAEEIKSAVADNKQSVESGMRISIPLDVAEAADLVHSNPK